MLLPAVFHENLFDDWFDPFFDDMDREMNRESHQVFGKRGANMMKTDVKDTGDAYEVAVDLPGCKKEDVKMELENGYLTIQAVRSHNNDKTDKEGHYVRRESFSGTCARSFYVGDELKPEDVKASFEDGILKLNLPKAEAKKLPEKQPTQIEIL